MPNRKLVPARHGGGRFFFSFFHQLVITTMNGLRQLYPNSNTPEYRRGRLACRMGCIIRTLMNARYGMTAAEICQSVNFAMGWDFCQRTYLRDINAMIEAGELEECGIGGPHDNKFKYRLGPVWQAFLAQKLSA